MIDPFADLAPHPRVGRPWAAAKRMHEERSNSLVGGLIVVARLVRRSFKSRTERDRYSSLAVELNGVAKPLDHLGVYGPKMVTVRRQVIEAMFARMRAE